jgi:hypothetical protein
MTNWLKSQQLWGFRMEPTDFVTWLLNFEASDESQTSRDIQGQADALRWAVEHDDLLSRYLTGTSFDHYMLYLDSCQESRETKVIAFAARKRWYVDSQQSHSRYPVKPLGDSSGISVSKP